MAERPCLIPIRWGECSGDWATRPRATRGSWAWGQVREARTARLLRRDAITAYTLGVDATLVEAEKREGRWSYQGVKGALSALGVLFETPVCLVPGGPGAFRSGRSPPPDGPALPGEGGRRASPSRSLPGSLGSAVPGRGPWRCSPLHPDRRPQEDRRRRPVPGGPGGGRQKPSSTSPRARACSSAPTSASAPTSRQGPTASSSWCR